MFYILLRDTGIKGLPKPAMITFKRQILLCLQLDTRPFKEEALGVH